MLHLLYLPYLHEAVYHTNKKFSLQFFVELVTSTVKFCDPPLLFSVKYRIQKHNNEFSSSEAEPRVGNQEFQFCGDQLAFLVNKRHWRWLGC